MKFPSIFASVLRTATCSFCVFTSNAATTEPRTENVSRTLTQNEEYDLKKGALTIDEGVTIDLAGYSLTYKNVSSFSGTGTITDTSTSNPGELHISPSKAGTFSAGLTGNIRLVMEGSSSLTLKDSYAYTGGTQIDGGKLVCGGSKYTLKEVTPFGKKPSTIEVNEGGTLDCNGKYGWDGYTIHLNGGTITSGGQRDSTTQIFNAPITLTENSSFLLPSSKIYSLAGEIDLSGNVLSMSLSSLLHYMPASIKDGSLDVTGTATFQVEKDLDMSSVNMKIAAPLNLQTYTIDVCDFETKVAPTGDGKIIVHGALKPVEEVAPVCTLASGATLDLSGVTMLPDLSKVAFADGVESIEITLGDAKPELGTPLADFGRALIGVTLSFKDDKTEAIVTDAGILTYGTSTAPVATWTGGAENGDVTDKGNWEDERLPSAEIAAVFSGEIGKLAIPVDANLDWTKVTFDNVTLSEDCDLSGLTPEIINASSKIDVGESMLTIAGKDGACECAAEITTESESGKFCIVVPENATYTNSAFRLTGKLNLVKVGPGTMFAVDNKDFEGELIVKAGKLVCGLADLSGKTPFGAACTITLEEGGVLDPMGSINWSAQTIKMNGGKIVNTVKATGIATGTGVMVDYKPAGQSNSTMIPFDPTLELLTDATIESIEDFNFQGTVKESDYTLNLAISKDHYFAWNPTSTPNLKLNVIGGGALATYSKKPVPLSSQSGIRLTMSDAALVLPMHNTYGSGTMEVTDYIAACTNSPTITGAPLKVKGTFTPAAVDEQGNEYFYGCTMQNDSAIDLSAKTGAWSVQSASLGKNTLEFAEGISGEPTRIVIKLGDRKLTLGEKVIAWADGQKPNFVAFFFARSDAADQTPAQVLADGLYYGEAQIAAAEWTGEAKNGDLSDPANWKGGKLPDGELTAKFTGDISTIVKPETDAFTCKDIYFNNVTLTEPTDLSWIDLNKITDASVIDIMGQTLKIASTNSISTTSPTITDTVGGGVVEFTVGEGVVHTNAALAFEGGLKFVKQGEGVFVAAKYPQLYTNVTEIAEGVLRCAEGANMNATDKNSPFGESFTVVLDEGAFLDPAGSYLWGYHTIEMNGGAISNTVMEIGANTAAYNAGSFPKPFNPTLVLKMDSLFVSTANFNFNGVIQPNGNKLTVCTAEELRWAPVKVNAAEVEFTGGGQLVTLKNTLPEMSDITLVMNDFTFDVGCLMVVSNYTAKAGKTDSVKNKGSWHEVGGMTVSGVFTPTADKFFGCQLLDGSTIDLSGKTDVWSTTTVSTYKNGPLVVTFADGATVTIDIHGRALRNNEQIVSWTEETKPEYFDNLTFKIDAKSKKVGYKLDKREDGIYAVYSGLAILLK